MSCKMFGLSLMLLMTIVIGAYGQECLECMEDNEAKCLDEKTYVYCVGGTAQTEEQKCEGDEVCTNSPDVCEPPANVNGDIKNICPDGAPGGKCGTCLESPARNRLYTCVTQTAFSRCRAGKPLSERSDCDDGEFCSTELYEATKIICASRETLEKFKMNVTCGDIRPPNPEESTRECRLEEVNWEGPVPPSFTIPYKNNPCKEYIRCERIRGTMYGTHITCPKYYNTETGKCVNNKPRICPDPPTTSTTTTTTTTTTTATPGVTP